MGAFGVALKCFGLVDYLRSFPATGSLVRMIAVRHTDTHTHTHTDTDTDTDTQTQTDTQARARTQRDASAPNHFRPTLGERGKDRKRADATYD